MYGHFFLPVHENPLPSPTFSDTMDIKFSKKYQPVPKAQPDDDTGSDATVTNRRRRHPSSPFLKQNLAAITISSLLLILILLVITIIAILTFEPLREVLIIKSGTYSPAAGLHGQRQCLPTTPRTTLSCGNSTTEAESLGCKYDPLSACWLHQQCPHDYSKEFETFNDGKPFVYYYDEAMTHQMKDYDEVGHNTQGFYWTSLREHLVHCLYLLRRGHDVHMRGDRLDDMLAKMEHVDHCTNFLANWFKRPDPELDNPVGTQGTTNCFMSCS
jgi:hypothetical protein